MKVQLKGYGSLLHGKTKWVDVVSQDNEEIVVLINSKTMNTSYEAIFSLKTLKETIPSSPFYGWEINPSTLL